MILYLAGPMTGLPDFNFPAFHEAAAKLRAAGYDVVTTAEGCEDTSQPWEHYMRLAIKALLECDAVALLPGWSESRGARIEEGLACDLGMPRGTVADWMLAAEESAA